MRFAFLLVLAACSYGEDRCGDGRDNDGDGRTDCDDNDCASARECWPTDTGARGTDVEFPTHDTFGESIPSTEIVWVDDGEVPTDTDGDGVADSGCGDELLVMVADPRGSTDWMLGIAEDGPMGWTGEDCLYGLGPYSFCHPVSSESVLRQVPDCRIESVVGGETTLFDASFEPFLTYVLLGETGCFVRGLDPGYYASLGCLEL